MVGGALMKLCCRFGLALEWDHSIGSVSVWANNIVSQQYLSICRARRLYIDLMVRMSS